MTALAPADAQRLIKLLGMLGSTFDGERASAALKAHELVRARGLVWSDIIRPSLPPPRAEPPPPRPEPSYRPAPSWRQKVAQCLSDEMLLSDWELGFLLSVQRRSRLTPKQQAALDRIADKVLTGDRP